MKIISNYQRLSMLATICALLLGFYDVHALDITVPVNEFQSDSPGASAGFSNPLRMQEVYSAALFPSQPIQIREITYRQDSVYDIGIYEGLIENIQFRMATTTKSPHGLSSRFEENLGPNSKLVFSGNWSFATTAIKAPSGANIFEVKLVLQTPFNYDPSQGNLLIEYRNFTGLSRRFHTDATSSVGGPSSLIFTDGNPNSLIASSSAPGADIIKIKYDVLNQEPTVIKDLGDKTLVEGEDLELSVGVNGAEPLIYQWFFQGEPLAGTASTNSILLKSAKTTNSGSYFVIVSNAIGSVTSKTAKVEVILPVGSDTNVFPARYVSAEGEGASAGFSNPLRLQELYSASTLPPYPITIREIRFRQDSQYYIGAYSGHLGKIRFKLSTSSKTTDTLSTTFDFNSGPDVQEVFFGPWDFSTSSISSPGGTKQFEIILRLQIPFRYDPSKGNLLLEYQNYSSLSQRFHTDAASGGSGAVRQIFFDGNAEAKIASAGSAGADVLQLVYDKDDRRPPLVLKDPTNSALVEGDSLQLTAVVTGAPPISYQWFHGSEPVDGANSATLSILAVRSVDAGGYSLSVSNAFGTNITKTVEVSVAPAGSISQTIVPLSNAAVEGKGASAGFSVQMRMQEVYLSNQFPSYPIQIREIRFRPDSTYSVGSFTGMLSRIVFKLSTTTVGTGNLSKTFASNVGLDQKIVYDGEWKIITSNRGPALGPKDFDIALKLQSPFLYDPAKGNLLLEYQNYGTLALRLHTDAMSGGGGPGGMVYFDGNSEALVASTATPGADVLQLVYSIADGVAPQIVGGPASQAVAEGATALFKAEAIGSFPLSYQWYFNEVAIPGQDNSVLRLDATTQSMSGLYSMRVSNKYGFDSSKAIYLDVIPNPPNLQVIPPSSLALEGNGASASLSVPMRQQEVYSRDLFDARPIAISQLRYRLDSNSLTALTGMGVVLSNATVRIGTTPKEPGQLSLTFSENLGSDLVDVFTGDWRVSDPPATTGSVATPRDFGLILQLTKPFIYHPLAGNLLVETVIPTHSPKLILNDAVSIPGRTQRVFIEDPLALQAAVSDSYASVIMVGYQLADVAPIVITDPLSLDAREESQAILNVVASGTGQLKYRWFHDGQEIVGENGSSLTIAKLRLADAGAYFVEVSNSRGVVTSKTANIAVKRLPAVLYTDAVVAPAGGVIRIPLVFRGHGDEQAVAFSLSWPANLLEFHGVDFAPILTEKLIINVNSNSVVDGRLGVAFLLGEGNPGLIGTNTIAYLIMKAAPVTTNQTAVLKFGDLPIAREIVDVLAHEIESSFVDQTIPIVFKGFEGDLTPRDHPDQRISLADWVQAGRFVAKLDEPVEGDEFRRIDCAPKDTSGDGIISIADWVQVGRYAAGLDLPSLLGGPSSPVNALPTLAALQTAGEANALKLGTASGVANSEIVIPVDLSAVGTEVALGFSFSFDPSALKFLGADQLPDAAGMVLNLNSKSALSGRVGVVIGYPIGRKLQPGTRRLLGLRFKLVAPQPGTYEITVGGNPVRQQTANSEAQPVEVAYISGSVTLFDGTPTLKISESGSEVTISWLTSQTDLLLQTTDTLIGGEWTTLNATKTILGDRTFITVPVGKEKQRYFRTLAP